jgi:hypothetical protein
MTAATANNAIIAGYTIRLILVFSFGLESEQLRCVSHLH